MKESNQLPKGRLRAAMFYGQQTLKPPEGGFKVDEHQRKFRPVPGVSPSAVRDSLRTRNLSA